MMMMILASCKSNCDAALTMSNKSCEIANAIAALCPRWATKLCKPWRVAKEQIARSTCNGLCELQSDHHRCQSAALMETSQKKSSYETNSTINHLLAIVASTRQINMSVLTWVIKNSVHFFKPYCLLWDTPQQSVMQYLADNCTLLDYWTIKLYWQFLRF